MTHKKWTKHVNLACVMLLGVTYVTPITSANTTDSKESTASATPNGSSAVGQTDTYRRYVGEFETASGQYQNLLQKIAEVNQSIEGAGNQVTLGQDRMLSPKTVTEALQLVNEHHQTTQEAIRGAGNSDQALRDYEERKRVYNANRDEIIKYNKDNASIEIQTTSNGVVANVVGNVHRPINIEKIFTKENSKKVEVNLIKAGDKLTLEGEEGVDVILTLDLNTKDSSPLLEVPDLEHHIFGQPLQFFNNSGSFTMEFIDHVTKQPVDIITVFDTYDFDQREVLSFKSDTGTAIVVSGVRSTSESQDGWLSFNGGYAPSDKVGRAGARTAFSGSKVSIKLENSIAILGIFDRVPFTIKQTTLKKVPAPFSETAPEKQVATVQKLSLSEADKERLKPIRPSVRQAVTEDGNGGIKTEEIVTVYSLDEKTGEAVTTEYREVLETQEKKIEKKLLEKKIRYKGDETKELGFEDRKEGTEGEEIITTTYEVNTKGEVEEKTDKEVVEGQPTIITKGIKPSVKQVTKDDGNGGTITEEITTTYTLNEETGEVTSKETSKVLSRTPKPEPVKEETSSVFFQFTSEDGSELPARVKQLLPLSITDTVGKTVLSPTLSVTEVVDGSTTWTFLGWEVEKTTLTIKPSTVKGVWRKTVKKASLPSTGEKLTSGLRFVGIILLIGLIGIIDYKTGFIFKFVHKLRKRT